MAKRFKFNLQAVLRYREMVEDEKKKAFAAANRAVEEQRLELERMDEERSAVQDEVKGLYQSKAGFQNVMEHYRYANSLQFALMHGAQKLRKLEATADEKRQAFIESRRDRRALELLKEKRQEEFSLDQARAEQKNLDELAVKAKARRGEF